MALTNYLNPRTPQLMHAGFSEAQRTAILDKRIPSVGSYYVKDGSKERYRAIPHSTAIVLGTSRLNNVDAIDELADHITNISDDTVNPPAQKWGDHHKQGFEDLARNTDFSLSDLLLIDRSRPHHYNDTDTINMADLAGYASLGITTAEDIVAAHGIGIKRGREIFDYADRGADDKGLITRLQNAGATIQRIDYFASVGFTEWEDMISLSRALWCSWIKIIS